VWAELCSAPASEARAETKSETRDDVRLLLEAAWAQGAWIERGGNDHFKIFPEEGDRIVHVPMTPSDWRTIKNKRAQLRRVGIDPDFNRRRK